MDLLHDVKKTFDSLNLFFLSFVLAHINVRVLEIFEQLLSRLELLFRPQVLHFFELELHYVSQNLEEWEDGGLLDLHFHEFF